MILMSIYAWAFEPSDDPESAHDLHSDNDDHVNNQIEEAPIA